MEDKEIIHFEILDDMAECTDDELHNMIKQLNNNYVDITSKFIKMRDSNNIDIVEFKRLQEERIYVIQILKKYRNEILKRHS